MGVPGDTHHRLIADWGTLFRLIPVKIGISTLSATNDETQGCCRPQFETGSCLCLAGWDLRNLFTAHELSITTSLHNPITPFNHA